MAGDKVDTVDLNQAVKLNVFARVVGISVPAVSDLRSRKILSQGATLGVWLREYTRHLREQAAGRGGDHQVDVARAKAESLEVKTARDRLDYHKEIGTLVLATQVAEVLNDWARYANREYRVGVDSIVNQLKIQHHIEIDRDQIDEAIVSITERIRLYAAELGQGFVGGIDKHEAEKVGIDCEVVTAALPSSDRKR